MECLFNFYQNLYDFQLIYANVILISVKRNYVLRSFSYHLNDKINKNSNFTFMKIWHAS